MSNVAILIPVLGRPHRVKPVLEGFRTTAPDCAVYFITDRTDKAEQRAIVEAGGKMFLFNGGFASKVNYGVRRTDEPLILIVGDDVEPQPGWLEAAKAHLGNGIHVVGINDLIERPNRPEHAVHFLITREYAMLGTFDEQIGPCCENYQHWFIDDELIATANFRNAYVYAEDSRIKHLHWMNGTADDDEVYQKGRMSNRIDNHMFHRRMRMLREKIHSQDVPSITNPDFGVTIGVATFGDKRWIDLANERAIPSARAQGVEVIHRHEATLQDARNAVLEATTTEFLINLDADDELEPRYVYEMSLGTADLRAPSVRCIRAGRPVSGGHFMPKIGLRGHRRHTHQCTGECLPYGNWLVCGTAARTELLRAVGGWWDEPIYEDWSLWLRCWKHGCTVEAIHKAVYRQHLSHDSRNHVGEAYENRFEWHEKIALAILGEVPA